ncbi:MAG: FAD-dependent oxidoreductase [Lachnospiraceae bacterium]|nr:FAD-dependent oxidoreductase [Lachnospiraceae bacterium]
MEKTFTGKVRERGTCDVFVAGGGVAGCAAALQAARLGKSVILAEKSIKLGGLATLGLVNLFVPMCNGRGKQIQFGMAEEFFRMSIRYGYGDAPKEFVNGRIPEEQLREMEASGQKIPRYKTVFDPEIFSMQLTEALKDAGVKLLFDVSVAGVVMDEEDPKKVKEVILLTAAGFESYSAAMFVDTTGDADLLAEAGVECRTRGNFHTYAGYVISLDSCQKAIDAGDIGKAFSDIAGGNANLYGGRHPEGMKTYIGVDPEDVNRYVIDNQLELLGKLKEPENRKKRAVAVQPGMPQFRTVRRIEADYVLKEGDEYRHFDDSIAAISDFARRDYLFEIPLRALVRKEFPNLITAGRSAAGEGFLWDVIRVIPPAILTGQAAGMAACHAIDEGCGIAEVDIRALQKGLEEAGVLIHFDDRDIPKEFFDKKEDEDRI